MIGILPDCLYGASTEASVYLWKRFTYFVIGKIKFSMFTESTKSFYPNCATAIMTDKVFIYENPFSVALKAW